MGHSPATGDFKEFLSDGMPSLFCDISLSHPQPLFLLLYIVGIVMYCMYWHILVSAPRNLWMATILFSSRCLPKHVLVFVSSLWSEMANTLEVNLKAQQIYLLCYSLSWALYTRLSICWYVSGGGMNLEMGAIARGSCEVLLMDIF